MQVRLVLFSGPLTRGRDFQLKPKFPNTAVSQAGWFRWARLYRVGPLWGSSVYRTRIPRRERYLRERTSEAIRLRMEFRGLHMVGKRTRDHNFGRDAGTSIKPWTSHLSGVGGGVVLGGLQFDDTYVGPPNSMRRSQAPSID
jgi:hypothetical protein